MIDFNKMENDLRRRVNDCRDEEKAAEEALQDAQLEAVQNGKAVPGALLDAVDAARKARADAEGAVAAFERGVEMGRASRNTERRRQIEARIKAAAAEFDKAAQSFIEELARLLDKGAGRKLIEARINLERAAASLPAATLTPQGWVTCDGVTALRATRPDELLLTVLGKLLEHRGEDRAREHTALIGRKIVEAAELQPETWLAD